MLTQALEGQRRARDDAAQTLKARSIPALDAQLACTFTPPTSATAPVGSSATRTGADLPDSADEALQRPGEEALPSPLGSLRQELLVADPAAGPALQERLLKSGGRGVCATGSCPEGYATAAPGSPVHHIEAFRAHRLCEAGVDTYHFMCFVCSELVSWRWYE